MSDAASTGAAVTDEGDSLTPLWTAYFVVVLTSTLLQALSISAAVVAILWRCARRCRRGEDTGSCNISERVVAVVPCYLPNEAPIIGDTVKHLLEGLRGLAELEIRVVYNTPVKLAAEDELQALAAGPMPPGRRLIVEQVPGSRSKAQNLNSVIPRIDAKYVVVYDADHHPDPDSLALAVSFLKETGADCVQGSTYIREGRLLPRCFVHAEFFITYFVVLPAMEALTGTAFFGGANGVWLCSSLQKLRFDEGVLTEDIDCFARAIVEHGLRFRFLPECRSGELLPNGFRAFWRQRLRWAMGWDEVTLTHAPGFWSAALPFRTRLGLYYIFVCRWFTQLCAVVIIVFNSQTGVQALLSRLDLQAPEVMGWTSMGEAPEGLSEAPDWNNWNTPWEVREVQQISCCFFLTFIIVVLLSAALQERGLRLLIGLVMYFAALPFYVMFGSLMLSVSLLKVASGNTGGWVVTERAGAQSKCSKLEAPLLETLPEPFERPHTSIAMRLLAVGFIAQGAGLGAVVGAFLGQKQVVHPLWGWVPFGIGATTTTVTDGRVVMLGVAAGTLGSVAILLGIRSCASRL